MTFQSCRHCGKEAEDGELYCLECRSASGVRRPRYLWVFSIVFSSVLLLLAGMLLWHGGFGFLDLSLDSILGRPAAVINGESIPRAVLKAKVRTIQGILERQHGKDIFDGERGHGLLGNLEKAVLKEMIEGKLISQEAARLGIRIEEKEVQRELEIISREIFGTWENFQTRLQEDGMSEDILRDDIRYSLLGEELKKAKAAKAANPEADFQAWLVQARRNAKVVIYDPGAQGENKFSPSENCCGIGGSPGCSGIQSPTGRAVDPKMESEAQRAALEAYRKARPSSKEVTAIVTDYGCHIQVDIQEQGKLVKSYTYQDGKVFEIS